MRIWVVLVFSMIFFGCSHRDKSPAKVNEDPKSLENIGLTYAESLERNQQVSQIQYKMFIHLDQNTGHFSGKTSLKFNYKKIGKNLRVDAKNMTIKSLVVNRIQIAQFKKDAQAIYIDENLLTDGPSHIEIDYQGEYSKTGSGFYRYVDKEDQRVYFYTDFEPFEASQLFPCFDQPNLKAKYKLTLLAPKAFKAISNYPIEQQILKGDFLETSFQETSAFSTYLVALHVGDFAEFSDQYNKTKLKLYVRQSLKKYVQNQFWFDMTKKGLNYFEKYFNYPYPYPKYDQIIVPDFNSGAMENVGAVTFSESFVRRAQFTQKEKEGLASVILHEMAHMWFGNLVTMEWWNGLWLNESFATFMSYKALSQVKGYESVWASFFRRSKINAYEEDQLSTSHPIDTEVLNTSEAFNNFDSITYGKGASVLKQLEFFVGADHFKNGIQNYIKSFAYKNTNLTDFLQSISNASNKNLELWSDVWLRKRGFDRFSFDSVCDKGIIKNLEINANATEGTTERIHAAKIALYSLDNQKLKNKFDFNTTFQVKNVIEEAKGLKCPDLILGNVEDYDFALQVFDQRGIFSIKKGYASIANPHTRLMIVYSLWDMALNSKMKLSQFIETYVTLIKIETHPIVLDYLFSMSDRIIYFKNNDLTLAKELEQIGIEKIKSSKQRDSQLILLDHLLRFARTKNGAGLYINSLLENKSSLIDQDRAWSAIITLCTLGFEQCDKLVKNQSLLDKTDLAQKYRLIALSRFPERKNKGIWLEKIFSASELSLTEKLRILSALFPRSQAELKLNYSHIFFKQIKMIALTYPHEFLETFAEAFAPLNCQRYNHDLLLTFMNKNTIHPVILKPLMAEIDLDRQCIESRESVK